MGRAGRKSPPHQGRKPIETPDGYVAAVIAGQSGSGKSTLVQYLVDCHELDVGPVLVLDCKDEAPDPVREDSIYAPPPDDENMEADGPYFDWVNRWCAWIIEDNERNGTRWLVEIDETKLCIKKGGIAPPALVKIVMQKRTAGISYVLATQRPISLPADLREQALDQYWFRLRGRRTLDVLADEDLDPKAVRKLRTGHYFHLRQGQSLPHFHPGLLTRCRIKKEHSP